MVHADGNFLAHPCIVRTLESLCQEQEESSESKTHWCGEGRVMVALIANRS